MKNFKMNEANLVRSDYFAVLISLVAAALVLMPLFTMASGRESVNVGEVNIRTIDAKRAAITLTNVIEAKYTLSIESYDGVEVFYTENITSAENFSKVFDFSRLKDGDYSLIVKAKNETKEKHFEIKNGELNIIPEFSDVPVFKYNGTKAGIEMLNVANKNISIRIYSPEGEELYSAVEKESVRKYFDFKNVEKGNYAVLVSTDNNSFQFNYIKE
jgi:hypothetical protein